MAAADLLVVGGGIVGVMTAVRARTSHPEWTIRVVERDRIGHGATGFSAGLSFPLARSPWQERLVRASHAEYARLRREFPGLPIRDIAVLWVVHRDQVGELAARVIGGAVTEAGEDRLAALRTAYPDLLIGPDEVVMTTSEPCFYGYPGDVAELLARWLRSTDPATVWEGIGVRRIGPGAEATWRAELTDDRVIEAHRMVLAVGPWPAGELVPETTAADRPRVKKVAALHIGQRPTPDAPCVVLWQDDAFLLPLAERGHYLFSYRNTVWDVDPETPDRLTTADVEAALAVLAPRSKRLAAGYVGGRAFCDAYTADLVPVLREQGGFAEAGGCSGSGFRLAPGLAAAALDAVGDAVGDAVTAAARP